MTDSFTPNRPIAVASKDNDVIITHDGKMGLNRWSLSAFSTLPEPEKEFTRGFLDTPHGQMHYRIGGEEFLEDAKAPLPIFFVHMNPRSSDEYRELMAIWCKTRCCIAMDLIGFGDSARPPLTNMPSIEDYAEHGIALLEKYNVKECCVFGNHTGAFVTGEMALRRPLIVKKYVIANAPWFGRNEEETFLGKDQLAARYKAGWHVATDGSHLMYRWNSRRHYVGSATVNHRWVIDDLKCFNYPLYAMKAVHDYVDKAEERLGLLGKNKDIKVLVLWGDIDVQEFERLALARVVDNAKIEAQFPGAKIVRLPSGSITMMNQMPYEITVNLTPWLDDVDESSKKRSTTSSSSAAGEENGSAKKRGKKSA